MSDHLLQQYPPWREAINVFLKEEHKPGDTLDFKWLYDNFALERPQKDTPFHQVQKTELQFLAQFKSFEEALLTEYQIALANVRGVGYKIVPPGEQTDWAERTGVGEVKKALRKQRDRLTNIDLPQLTPEQRKANADALARLAMMASMVKRAMDKRSVLAIEEDNGEKS